VTEKHARKRTAKNVVRPRAPPRIHWTRRALTDLERIGDHIARDDLAAAERWVTKLIAAAENAATAPLAGRRVPELGRNDVRETFVRTYRIVYCVTAARIVIVTVFEGHRLFPGDVEPPHER
jgi:toxin ParE1/3/4